MSERRLSRFEAFPVYTSEKFWIQSIWIQNFDFLIHNVPDSWHIREHLAHVV